MAEFTLIQKQLTCDICFTVSNNSMFVRYKDVRKTSLWNITQSFIILYERRFSNQICDDFFYSCFKHRFSWLVRATILRRFWNVPQSLFKAKIWRITVHPGNPSFLCRILGFWCVQYMDTLRNINVYFFTCLTSSYALLLCTGKGP